MQSKSDVVFHDLSHDIKKKGLAPLIRDLDGLEVKIRYLLNHKQFGVICYVIRDFRGQNGSIFDLVYLENNKHFEQRYRAKVAWNHVFSKIHIFSFSLYGPVKEIWSWPLKTSFFNISKTIKNFWTLVEQNMFEMTRPFFWYQEKGAGPLF